MLVFGFAYLCSCSQQKQVTATPVFVPAAVVDLQVTLLVDSNDYSCTFRLLNVSDDTVEVLSPEMLGTIGYFRLMSADQKEIKPGCVTIYPADGPPWIQLNPRQPVDVKGFHTLKQLLCYMTRSDLIAYVYQGRFKTKSNLGLFGFTIPPTHLEDLDSVTMKIKLF